MTPMRPIAAAVLLLSALAPVAVTHAAPNDAVLARLHRIARGDWVPAEPPPPLRVPWAQEIRAAARRNGLSPSLLAALVRAESAFDPRAVSWAGAQGLGQLMPKTARHLGVADPFDPVQNLDGSARYLAVQVRRFRSVRLALAAYHAGPQRASHGLDAAPWTTRRYVARVMQFEREYRQRGLP